MCQASPTAGQRLARMLALSGSWLTMAASPISAEPPMAAAIPFWQAPALPGAVVELGQMPAGWQPQAVPYQVTGPDGQVTTAFFAPTYVFTCPPGTAAAPPQPAAVAGPVSGPVPVPINRIQNPLYVPPPPRYPQSSAWLYRAERPATIATVAYWSQPFRYSEGARALSGEVIAPPGPLPRQAPASQWAEAASLGPPAVAARPASPPPLPQATEATPAQPPAAVPAPAGPPTDWGPVAVPPGAGAALELAGTPPTIPAVPGMVPTVESGTPAQMASVVNPPPTAPPRTYQWRVIGVIDGDTVSCLDESNQEQRVNLAGIDAPEPGMPYAAESREALADLVFGKAVTVLPLAQDATGVWTASLFLNGSGVSRGLVAGGNARVDPSGSGDPELVAAEEQARSRGLGLWAVGS